VRCLASALALGLLAAGCSVEPPRRPNLLLVTLDTTRADHVSAYGYPRDTTPVLRELADAGTRFAQAYAPAATTGPSHATLFTSLYPLAHGIVSNGLELRASELTLAEILRARGWATAAFVSSFVLDARFGYAQGFDLYDDEFAAAEATFPAGHEWREHAIPGGFDRTADATTRRAVDWLAKGRDPARSFFLFVHYFDPHAPMSPPAAYAARFAPAPGSEPSRLDVRIGRYDGEIAFVDERIGELLGALDRAGLADDTLVAVTADHGEGLLAHGQMAHGVHLYEEAVRVPLLLRWPGVVPAGRVVEAPVALVDLAPTLLELLGVPAPEAAFQGESLARAVVGGAEPDPERAIHLQRRHYDGERVGEEWIEGDLYGVRQGRWKYLESGDGSRRELYDLAADPGETENLADRNPGEQRRLAARIASWKAASRRGGEAPRDLTGSEHEGLRALGYVE
jgi:arylsulfatase A-like enzyme